jgi:hypothetical protein
MAAGIKHFWRFRSVDDPVIHLVPINREYFQYSLNAVNNLDCISRSSYDVSIFGFFFLGILGRSDPALNFRLLKTSWLRDASTVQHPTTVRSAHTVFMCFVFV